MSAVFSSLSVASEFGILRSGKLIQRWMPEPTTETTGSMLYLEAEERRIGSKSVDDYRIFFVLGYFKFLSTHTSIQDRNIYAFKLGDSGRESLHRGIARVVELVDLNYTCTFSLSLDLRFSSIALFDGADCENYFVRVETDEMFRCFFSEADICTGYDDEKSSVGTGGLKHG